MKEAAAIAPTSPTVLEALGDDLVERRQYKEAMSTYKRALKLAPRNVSVETKLAQAALRMSGMGTIEQQLRMGDSAFINRSDSVASVGTARFLNAFVPGVGHMVLGRTVTGISLLVGWALCIGIIAAMQNDVKALLRLVAGKDGHPNMVVVIPLFVALVIWIGAQAALGVDDRGSARKKVDRPKPPVDLPFE
jgi:tetratricopeptide (TPR) repeat protein